MNAKELAEHKGHQITVVTYGSADTDWETSIECETCNTVLHSVSNDGDVPESTAQFYTVAEFLALPAEGG